MAITKKGKKILSSMKKEYGSKKGKKVFFASKNKGTIKGIEMKHKGRGDMKVMMKGKMVYGK